MRVELLHGDCLTEMSRIAGGSVDCILTDPPYYRVKSEGWDRQWDTAKGFLCWLDCVIEEFARILKPNGSLYLFASPQMSARVECLVSERLHVLNHIRWCKEAGWHNKTEKEALRGFLSPWESIIFAEHFGADNNALGLSGYQAKCDELRGFLFEPIRAYLESERIRAGITRKQIEQATGTQMAGHWFSRVQWELPTQKHYETLQRLFNAQGGDYLRREYEDLRREYEDLRREYEDLRRPFYARADAPYTDVWTFKTVGTYPGKHPCEKPQALLRHAISVSTRPGALVLDAFAGTGSTGLACINTGRNFIGIEKDPDYFRIGQARIEAAQSQTRLALTP